MVLLFHDFPTMKSTQIIRGESLRSSILCNVFSVWTAINQDSSPKPPDPERIGAHVPSPSCMLRDGCGYLGTTKWGKGFYCEVQRQEPVINSQTPIDFNDRIHVLQGDASSGWLGHRFQSTFSAVANQSWLRHTTMINIQYQVTLIWCFGLAVWCFVQVVSSGT